MRIRIALLLTVVLCLNACVSTTTGRPRAEPSAPEDAAKQYYQLGARYYRNGTYELARDRLLRALELDPKLAVAHSTLALTYVGLDNLRLAGEHFDRAVRLAPDNIDVRNSYAVFLCQQKRYDEAHQQFQRARRLTINDRPEILLTNAGVCMAQKPDFALAEQYFREALEHKASYGEALLQMTLLKRAQGEDLASRAFLQRFLASNPVTAQMLLLGVEIERTIGDDRAREEFETRLLREFPKSPEARRVLQNR
jgi:type IV pilus assembly protein PilF